MGRNKIEKEFSEKLSTREINPSAAAWDRLDAMLTTAETQKNASPVRLSGSGPKRRYWLFVAAAIVGIALFSSLFLVNGNDGKTVDVSTSGVAETESVQAEDRPDSVEAPEVQMAGVAPAETVRSSSETTISVQPRHQKQMLAVNQKNPEKAIEPGQQETQSSIEKQSVQSQSVSTNGDIPESLLAAIKSKTEAQKTSGVKVNAHDLLQDVDKEPELTKRQRFLRTVQNVKVAVENRNLEENH